MNARGRRTPRSYKTTSVAARPGGRRTRRSWPYLATVCLRLRHDSWSSQPQLGRTFKQRSGHFVANSASIDLARDSGTLLTPQWHILGKCLSSLYVTELSRAPQGDSRPHSYPPPGTFTTTL